MPNSKETFCRLVDGMKLPSTADAIFVLRNWDIALSEQRLKAGLKLLFELKAGILLMSMDEHTKAEAERLFGLAMELVWKRVVIVTHDWHSYRAMLTFIKQFDGSGISIYVAKVPGELPDIFGHIESAKIELYQEKGDIATYEQGVHYTASLGGK